MAAAAAPNGNSNGNHHGLQGDECCYGTAVGTGTARYQNPGRWIWPDPTAGRVWYRAVPILSMCSTTWRTEMEGQKRNFACNNRIGRDGWAARTLEALGFSIDRRRRLLEIRVLDETIRRLEQLFRFTQANNPGPAVLLRIIGRINRANARRSTLFAQLHTYIRRRRRRHHQQQAPPSPPAGGNIASNGNGAAINNGNSNNAATGAPPADA
uniref:Uncharacterized protein n=1 Tax=Oryza barthii TaxID=65489 RepID=A0A0D3G1Z6_9ORYZ